MPYILESIWRIVNSILSVQLPKLARFPETREENSAIKGLGNLNADTEQRQDRSTSAEVERHEEVERAKFCARLRSLIPHRRENEFARAADISANALRHTLKTGNPGRISLIGMARAAGVTVDWLATGEGPMRQGEAQKAPVAEPEGQAPQAVSDGLPPRYAGHNAGVSGVKAAVSLALDSLAHQALDPERLADLVDAVHQLLEAGADPDQLRRLIAAASTCQPAGRKKP